MLYISKTSNDFTPIFQGLLFTIQSDEATDITVDIFNATSNTVIGTKSLSNITEAVIDIAPYINRSLDSTKPLTGASRLEECHAESYYITVSDAINLEISDTLIVCNNLEQTSHGVHTSLSLSRNISYKEEDDLRIYAPPQTTITAEITSDAGDSLSLELFSTLGVAQLHINTADFSPSTKELTVKIYFNDSLFQSVSYNLIPRYKGAQRVVWVSDKGTIERYTFPVVKSKELKVVRHTTTNSLGQLQTIRLRKSKIYTLVSEGLTDATLEGLAAIIAAPKVWFEEDGVFNEVTVGQSDIKYHNFGNISSLSITFTELGEEVAL